MSLSLPVRYTFTLLKYAALLLLCLVVLVGRPTRLRKEWVSRDLSSPMQEGSLSLRSPVCMCYDQTVVKAFRGALRWVLRCRMREAPMINEATCFCLCPFCLPNLKRALITRTRRGAVCASFSSCGKFDQPDHVRLLSMPCCGKPQPRHPRQSVRTGAVSATSVTTSETTPTTSTTSSHHNQSNAKHITAATTVTPKTHKRSPQAPRRPANWLPRPLLIQWVAPA